MPNLSFIRYRNIGVPLIGLCRKWLKRFPLHEAANARSLTENSITKPEEPPTWKTLPGTHCIKLWAEDLNHAIVGNKEADKWRLVGIGAVIEGKDLDMSKLIFQRVALDAGLRFLHVPSDDVLSLSFESLTNDQSSGPLMAYLEPGAWMLKKVTENAKQVNDFRRSLNTFMKQFSPHHPVLFVTAAIDLDDMEDSLRASGVFDRRFKLQPRTPLEVGADFLEQLGLDVCAPSLLMLPHKIGILVQQYPHKRMRDLHVLHLQRIAARACRQLEFIDVVTVAVEGSVESDGFAQKTQKHRHSIAVHEAGHAVVAIIDSAGDNIPEYLSIREASNHNGVMVDSYVYGHAIGAQLTYAIFCQQIRGFLAGRAAEEVVCGAAQISCGSRSDLVEANMLAVERFSKCGFAPNMDCGEGSSSNLTIVDDERPGEMFLDRIDAMTRQFLDVQYQKVVTMLLTNREFLDEVTECLLVNEVMGQESLTNLSRKYLPVRNHRLPILVASQAA